MKLLGKITHQYYLRKKQFYTRLKIRTGHILQMTQSVSAECTVEVL